MTDSRVEQEKPVTSWAKKQGNAQTMLRIVKRTADLDWGGAPIGQICDNFRIKINNDSNRLKLI